jgi:YD repeat-containing protein
VSFTDPLHRTVTFGYDSADRITSQTLPDGRVIGFAYDANGSVTQVVPPGRPAHLFSYTPVDLTRGYTPPAVPGTGSTTYRHNGDKQLARTYANASFTYAPNGELLTKTVAGQVSHHVYDALGNLRSVTQPDGTLIEHVIEGRGRRVGKKVNGTLVTGWLYTEQLRIVAELDGTGVVVSRSSTAARRMFLTTWCGEA